jgi:type II/III secretion system protein
VRFITLNRNSLQDLTGEKAKDEVTRKALLKSSDPCGAFLNDKEVHEIFETIQGDRRTSLMQAPKMTLFDGQFAKCEITDTQFYVTEVDSIEKGGQVVFNPKNEPFSTGLKMTFRPNVSNDRKFVRLHLTAEETSVAAPVTPLFPITTFITPQFEDGHKGEPIPFTQFLQQPSFNTMAVDKRFAVPNGGTVLLGGWTKVESLKEDGGTPILKDLPYIGDFFAEATYRQETKHVYLMVTTHVIVNKEDKPQPAQATCPYLKAQAAKKAAPEAPASAAPCSVQENLEKLERARKEYLQAEFYRRTGHPKSAYFIYKHVQDLCPGSRYDKMACARLEELKRVAEVPAAKYKPENHVIQAQETQTGYMLFGIGANSDAGLAGSIVLNERNFDIEHPADSTGGAAEEADCCASRFAEAMQLVVQALGWRAVEYRLFHCVGHQPVKADDDGAEECHGGVVDCPASKAADLVKKYHEACSAGRLAEATQLAVQALAVDPACFSKDK